MIKFVFYMQAPTLHICKGQHFWLTPHRAIFWKEEQCLIVSDLHLGKTGHFRKSGIPVPTDIYQEDLQRLLSLIQHFNPIKLLINGDLFHSSYNAELELFREWRASICNIEIILVRGNHDILSEDWYKAENINCYTRWEQFPFVFVHDIKDVAVGNSSTLYPITGHLHPGVQLNGMGKQSLRLPCYYFGESFAILPAYSKFTGTMQVPPQKRAVIYGITEDAVLSL